MINTGNLLSRIARSSWSRSTRGLADAAAAIPPTVATKPAPPTAVVQARKKNIPQSPWKMNFLVKLVRGKWVPDALAQLKFTPKRRAEDVSKILQRAVSIALQTHQAIPEELMVKEIFVTKGLAQKRQRIMGRGRTGVGYKRTSHVNIKVERIDFQQLIDEARSANQKNKWQQRRLLVADIQAGKAESIKVAPLSARPA